MTILEFEMSANKAIKRLRKQGLISKEQAREIKQAMPHLPVILGGYTTHDNVARRLAEERAPEGLRLYDPVPMRMTRLARRERAQLLVEADQRGPLQAFLADWVAVLYRQRSARELRWQLDVDPLDV